VKQHAAMRDGPKGQAGCLGCHDPHATDVKGLLKRTGNDLCYACHRKDAFAKKVGHAPVAQSCQTCHDPHASPQEDILVKPVTELCQQCHAPSNPPW